MQCRVLVRVGHQMSECSTHQLGVKGVKENKKLARHLAVKPLAINAGCLLHNGYQAATGADCCAVVLFAY